MNAPASLQVQVPGVDFAGLAREAIAAKITEALLGAESVVPKIVAAAIGTKVNKHGTVSNYSYENDTPYVEWLFQDLIRKVTKEIVTAKIESMKPDLEKMVETTLRKSVGPVSRALVDGFVNRAKNAYSIEVGIAVKPREP